MKIGKLLVMLIIILMSTVSCNNSNSSDKQVEEIKADIQQVVKDIYSPKNMKQFKDSYKRSIESGLLLKDAADKLYEINGDELTDNDLKRSSYVDVMYSKKEDNSDGVEHYLVKLQMHGADGTLTKADIFLYLQDADRNIIKGPVERVSITNVSTD